MIEAVAPGKLYIAGEYAIVHPGEPAVLVAVDRVLRVALTNNTAAPPAAERDPRAFGTVRSHVFGDRPLRWHADPVTGEPVFETDAAATAASHVTTTLATVDQLRREHGLPPRTFDLTITSELDAEDGTKLGLGSSGAVVVALVRAISAAHGLDLDHLTVYRLAMLVTVQLSPKASGGDLAAATFGGWISYRSPDRAVLRRDLAAHGVAAALTSAGWQGSHIERLPSPEHARMFVGWTGTPAHTDTMVDQAQATEPRLPSMRPDDPAFLDASRAIVHEIETALRTGGDFRAPLTRARHLLHRLSVRSSTVIETEALRALCDIAESFGAGAKPSGAGGGDCGIAIAPATLDDGRLTAAWTSAGITPLPVSVWSHPPARSELPLPSPTIGADA